MDKDKKDVTIEQFNNAIDALLQKPPEELDDDEKTTGMESWTRTNTCLVADNLLINVYNLHNEGNCKIDRINSMVSGVVGRELSYRGLME